MHAMLRKSLTVIRKQTRIKLDVPAYSSIIALHKIFVPPTDDLEVVPHSGSNCNWANNTTLEIPSSLLLSRFLPDRHLGWCRLTVALESLENHSDPRSELRY